VPQTTGRWQVPATSWVTFDPVAGAYHTVATTPQPLVATPAAPRPQVPATTVRPSATAPSWWRGFLPAFVAGVGAAVAATIVLLSWRRRGRRDRPARRRLLARLGTALAEPQPRQAAGAAEEAWREFLGARFSCSPDTQPAQWPRLFAAQGMQPGLAGELLRLFDDLHYLRYAPQLASTDSLQRELLERSRRLARRLA
jgi:hypothetical protein